MRLATTALMRLRWQGRSFVCKRFAIFENFFKGPRDVVDVGAWAEKQALLQPEALFAAEKIAHGHAGFSKIEFGAGFWEVWAEGFVAKKRLLGQGKAVAGGAGDALGLQRFHHKISRRAKFARIDPHHEEMVTVARAFARALLRINAGQGAYFFGKVLAILIAANGL